MNKLWDFLRGNSKKVVFRYRIATVERKHCEQITENIETYYVTCNITGWPFRTFKTSASIWDSLCIDDAIQIVYNNLNELVSADKIEI